jgi:cytochrome c-type biogenesis protein CcmH
MVSAPGLLALLAIASIAAAPSSTPKGQSLSGEALNARTEEVAGLLRCPVCQGLSVADSPSTMARNMKAQVREKLAAGFDQEQILAGFERSYGEFVRLQPQLRGVNWLVWLGPAAALLAGAGGVALAMRRARRHASPAAADEPPSRDALPDDPRLAAAVRQVRQLAYGRPAGEPPTSPAT